MLLNPEQLFATTSCRMNELGVELVKQYEGFYEKPYMDAGVLAIGYGTRGAHIKYGVKWTENYADKVLRLELDSLAVEICKHLNPFVNENQLAALVSFAYNVGIGRLFKAKILEDANIGKFTKALKYTRSQGIELKGLVRRRQAEKILFGMIP